MSRMQVAGIEVRDQIESTEGRIAWLTDRAAEQLRAAGRLVSTRSDHVIPQHVARTPNDLEALLAEYQSFAESLSSRCVLRGQSRDYFDDDGFLSVLPYSFRTPELRDEFEWTLRRSSRLDDMLSAWESVLSSLGIDVDSLGRKERILDGQKIIVHDRAATTRVASNPQFGAILQHYGFPTPHLDATDSAAVALYFALHHARITPDGLLYEPVEGADGAARKEPIPTLHIFLAHSPLDLSAPTIELQSLLDLVQVARRPVVQQAHSLTFVVHHFDVVGVEHRVLYAERFFPRFPVAVVKLSFSYALAAKRFGALAQRELFPRDEPLYKALLSANAPRLTRYA